MKTRRVHALVLAVWLSGCASVQRLPAPTSADIPMYDKMLEIHAEPFIIHQNDCSNKATRYVNMLLANGIPAHIVVLRPLIYAQGYDHAVVAVKYKGRRLYIDPSQAMVTADLADWGTFQYAVRNGRIYSDSHRFVNVDMKEFTEYGY